MLNIKNGWIWALTRLSNPENVATGDAGLVVKQPAIADLADAPTGDDFNELLAALRAAGVLAAE